MKSHRVIRHQSQGGPPCEGDAVPEPLVFMLVDQTHEMQICTSTLDLDA